MLTGRPPFRAETPLETVLQVLHEEPVPPAPPAAEGPARPGDDLPEVPGEGPPAALRTRPWSWPRTSNGSSTSSRSGPGPSPRRSGSGGGAGARRSLAIAVGLAAVAIAAAIGLSISLAVYQYRAASRIGEALRGGPVAATAGRPAGRPTWPTSTARPSASRATSPRACSGSSAA